MFNRAALENGVIKKTGSIDEVMTAYVGSAIASPEVKVQNPVRPETPTSLVRVFVTPHGGVIGEPIRGSAPFSIGVEIEVQHAGQIEIFLHCYNDRQQMIFSTGSFFENSLNGLRLDAGKHLFECTVPGYLLTDGTYSLDVMLLKNRMVITTEAAVLSFDVADDFPRVDGWHYRPAGIVRPKTTWRRINYRNGIARISSTERAPGNSDG